MVGSKIVSIISCMMLLIYPLISVAKEGDFLNVIPKIQNNISTDGQLSRKSKKVLKQIYQDQQQRNNKRNIKSKYNIDRMSDDGKINLEGYDVIEGEGRFNIEIKKPGKKLEKKYNLYRKAYDAMLDAQYEMAIFYYEDILKKYSKDEYALVGLALAYHYLGDIVLAKKFYAKAINIYPNNISAVNNFLILIGSESPEESLPELLKLEEVFNRNHVLKAQISYLYAKQEKYDDALTYIDLALAMSKNKVLYLYNKAVILDYQGNYTEAKELYNKILNFRSTDVMEISIAKIKHRLNNMEINGI